MSDNSDKAVAYMFLKKLKEAETIKFNNARDKMNTARARMSQIENVMEMVEEEEE